MALETLQLCITCGWSFDELSVELALLTAHDFSWMILHTPHFSNFLWSPLNFQIHSHNFVYYRASLYGLSGLLKIR